MKRTRGAPQGSVISPVLRDLFMHYVFDLWMKRNYPENPWCRYCDDGLVHTKTEKEALDILTALSDRFKECGLEQHPEKTRIVYCKDGNRRSRYSSKSFDFLGYTFRPRVCKNEKSNKLFVGFSPAESKKSLKAMCRKVRKLNVRNRTDLELNDIAN